MTQEDKQLLQVDLCARLPYGVKVLQNNGIESIVDACPRSLNGLTVFKLIWDSHHGYWNCCGAFITDFKPYLRPMSSMTEEEAEEFRLNFHYNFYIGRGYSLNNKDGSYMMPMFVMKDYFDWLNKHHFDYRGLIEKGLALEAPKDMYSC